MAKSFSVFEGRIGRNCFTTHLGLKRWLLTTSFHASKLNERLVLPETTLDPEDWIAFRKQAHEMLDAALDKMQSVREGPVWTPLPAGMKSDLKTLLPKRPQSHADIVDQLTALLPYGVGNTHPRFFGWVHGAGNPGGILAEIAAVAMNANLGGRDHGAIYVERQVLDWCRQMMGFPLATSGLITSGTSMGTIVALKVARDRALSFANRSAGAGVSRLVGYTSEQAHTCLAQAFDILGIGSAALRKIPIDENFRMDLDALASQIETDRSAGLTPFAVIGTAGSVNVGAIDDLTAIAEIAAAEGLWFHVDGAFGATGILSEYVRPMLAGMERADSLAFDFHKWLHVNYAAGCVLIRDAKAHLGAFTDRPEYLTGYSRGLAAGAPWPVDYGPELSRGFAALKIWSHFLEHGSEKLGNSITKNCDQAQLLARLVDQHPLKLLAPVNLNIVCFCYEGADIDNEEIVLQLQEKGLAAPSTTRINGQVAIRVNITNHRTEDADMQFLVDQVIAIGDHLTNKS